MIKRLWVTLIFALISACATASRPNFVVVFFDDVGWGDFSCYGQTNYKTPNIDRLAAEGMRMTDFHSVSPVCSPSRAGLLTGCLPTRVGIPRVLFPPSKTGLNPNEETIPELLKQRGYKTAIFGKWHLGLKNLMPPTHGFDEYYGIPYSNDMWPFYSTNQPPLHWFDGYEQLDEIKDLNDQGLMTGKITEKAVDFINRNRKNPFFLYVPHPMTHIPLAASPKFEGSTGAGLYADVMAEVDWSVGEIAKALEKNGIDKNTVFIVTSDNGPWLVYGNHAGVSGGFREGKITTFEGGMRVPMIVRWPGHIPAGTVNDTFSTMMDILPTFANLADAPSPKLKIDGHDVWPVWSGQTTATPYRSFPYYAGNGGLHAVRGGRWKLVLPHNYHKPNEPRGMDGKNGGAKNVPIELSLFDLQADPYETKNLVDQHPELVEKLQKVANGYRQQLGDTITKTKGSEVRPPGQVTE